MTVVDRIDEDELELSEHGVNVTIGYRSRQDDAYRVVDEASSLGVTCTAYAFDVSTREIA